MLLRRSLARFCVTPILTYNFNTEKDIVIHQIWFVYLPCFFCEYQLDRFALYAFLFSLTSYMGVEQQPTVEMSRVY
jgi:hypothetical protein